MHKSFAAEVKVHNHVQFTEAVFCRCYASEICNIFTNTFFYRTPQVAAFEFKTNCITKILKTFPLAFAWPNDSHHK